MHRFILASILLFACATDPAQPDDLTDSDGKSDGFGIQLVETKLAEEVHQPDLVMQDDAFVYYLLFTEDDEQADPQTRTLMRASKRDGGSEKIATLPISAPNHAALGGDAIYLSDFANVYAIAKTGAGEVQTIATFDNTVWALTADATGVYVAHQVGDGQRITRLPGQLELARATFVTSMASDATTLYWLDETQPNPAIGCGKNAGFAHQIAKTGGLDITLAAGINCPLTVAADASGVYYTNWAMTGPGNPIVRLPRFGLPQVMGFAGGADIGLEPGHVSWLSPQGTIQRRAKSFGLARDVASNVDFGLLQADAGGMFFWRRNAETAHYELYRLGR